MAGLRALGGEHLEERLQIVGRCEARLAAVRAETVAALARRDGEARAADVLRNDLKQSRGGAKRDVKIAGQLAELPETAEALAELPETAEALAEGAITPQHARIIAEASEHTPVDEAELLAAAGHEPIDVFARTVRDHVNDRSGDDLEERRRPTTCGVDGAVNQPLRRFTNAVAFNSRQRRIQPAGVTRRLFDGPVLRGWAYRSTASTACGGEDALRVPSDR